MAEPAHAARQPSAIKLVDPLAGRDPPLRERAPDRTPCWRCGVRADVGCSHTRPLVETVMTTKRQIALPVEGATLAAIERRARDNDVPLGRAALELVEHGLDALERPSADDDGSPGVALEDVHVDALLAEVKRRFERAEVGAVARANAAEAKLAAAREALAG